MKVPRMKGLIYRIGSAGKVALTGLLGVVFLSACNKSLNNETAGDEGDVISVEFRLGSLDATRMVGVTDAEESNVERWVLFVFTRGGSLIGEPTVVESSGGISAGEKSVVRTLAKGQYRIFAFCNYPTSGDDVFDPSNLTFNDLQDKKSAMVSNTRGCFVMSGRQDYTVRDSGTKYISVSRLISKAEVTKVTVNMSEDSWKAKTFVLKRMYLTNVCTYSLYFGVSIFVGIDSAYYRYKWYNTMGYHTSGSGYYNGSEFVRDTSEAMDALTADDSINAVIPADGGTYETAHTFYFYPNRVSEGGDQPGSSWYDENGNGQGTHRTRLVLECSLDGTTYYYVVSLPPSERNNSYIMSDVTISRPGSTDPEVETPGAVTVTWETATDDWYGPYTVTENS